MMSCKRCVHYEKATDLNDRTRHYCRLAPITFTEDMAAEEAETTGFLADDLGCAKGRPKNATCADCDHARPLTAGGMTSVLRVECHRNPPSWVGDTFARAFVLKTETCGHWQNLRMGEFDE